MRKRKKTTFFKEKDPKTSTIISVSRFDFFKNNTRLTRLYFIYYKETIDIYHTDNSYHKSKSDLLGGGWGSELVPEISRKEFITLITNFMKMYPNLKITRTHDEFMF